MPETFSRRNNYSGGPKEISVREAAPENLRFFVLDTVERMGVTTSDLRSILCSLLRVPPDRDNWSEPNVAAEIERLLYSCEWFRVYDFIEVLYGHFAERGQHSPRGTAEGFENAFNEFCIEEGIGWQLSSGIIVTRGQESFESSVKTAASELKDSGRPTAASRIHDALLALSRRPSPDYAGAISHAIASLECVAGDAAGDSKATLADVLKNYPNVVGGLRKSIEGAWGYSCNEGARHGKEGKLPVREDAELIVGLSASIVTYLSRKYPRNPFDA